MKKKLRNIDVESLDQSNLTRNRDVSDSGLSYDSSIFVKIIAHESNFIVEEHYELATEPIDNLLFAPAVALALAHMKVYCELHCLSRVVISPNLLLLCIYTLELITIRFHFCLRAFKYREDAGVFCSLYAEFDI